MNNRTHTLRDLTIFLCLFTSQILCAQQVSIRGKVVDDSLQPLKYVSIGIVNTTIGTVSNDLGEFVLRFGADSISENDSLKFSIVGYQAKCLPVYQKASPKGENDTTLVIMLVRNFVQLQEVTVTSKNTMSKTLGTHNKSLLNLHCTFAESGRPNQNLGSEIGRKFQISKNNTRLEALRFFLSHNNFDSIKFRINVYSIKHGKPNQNLLHENIYLDIKDRKKGWIGIDLSPYNILVSENIIVSLEWISKSAKGKSLTLPIVMPTLSAHFYKYGSQNKWKRFNSMSTYMELQIKSGR